MIHVLSENFIGQTDGSDDRHNLLRKTLIQETLQLRMPPLLHRTDSCCHSHFPLFEQSKERDSQQIARL